jgi:hypothetical protein
VRVRDLQHIDGLAGSRVHGYGCHACLAPPSAHDLVHTIAAGAGVFVSPSVA